jgi:hypothetical protein
MGGDVAQLVTDAEACTLLAPGLHVSKAAWSLELTGGSKAFRVGSWFDFALCVAVAVIFLAGGLWAFSLPVPPPAPPAPPAARIAWGQEESWTVPNPGLGASDEAGAPSRESPPKDPET